MRAGLGASKGVKGKRVVPTRNPRGRAAWLASHARWASREANVRFVLGTGALRVALDRRAGADEIAVAQRVVDAAYGRPVLVGAHPGHREGGLLARVGALPLGGQQHLGGVRGVLQHVVLA